MNGKKLVRRESIAWICRQVEGNVHYVSHAGCRCRVPFTHGSFDGSAMDEINVTVPDRSFSCSETITITRGTVGISVRFTLAT